jgi:hypothetical protein
LIGHGKLGNRRAFSKPQLEHLIFSDSPHSPQNFNPLAFSKPQAGQRMILGQRAEPSEN